MTRWLSGPRLALVMLSVVTAGGTVGFREVHPLSRAGQAFTLLLIISGVGTAFYTATLLATAIVEGGLPRRFVRRRIERMLVGQTIVEAGIRQKLGLIVVAIRREDGTMDFNPSPESEIRAGDELVVLGRPQSVKALEERVAA